MTRERFPARLHMVDEPNNEIGRRSNDTAQIIKSASFLSAMVEPAEDNVIQRFSRSSQVRKAGLINTGQRECML